MRRVLAGLVVVSLAAGTLCLGCASSQNAEGSAPASQKELAAAWPLSNESHVANNMKCGACHDEEDPTQGAAAVTADTCLSCHGSYERVAERTAAVGEDVNPHDNFHYDMQLDCTTCHKSHSESVNLCLSCHDADLWMNDIP